MDSTLLAIGPAAWLLLAVLLGTAALISALVLDRSPGAVLAAGGRAVLQLAVVALLISQLARYPLAALGFVVLMFGVASFTAGRRVNSGRRGLLMALPIASGVLPVLGLMLASGVLPFSALALIAVAGQLIGGAMTAAVLAGRRILGDLQQRNGEVEAALALGFSGPEARMLIIRPVAGEALIPALDQTRTVGMVTLPGAFVGLILGGASPLDAALVQLLVLVALLAVEALAIAVVLYGCARAWWLPQSPAGLQPRPSGSRTGQSGQSGAAKHKDS